MVQQLTLSSLVAVSFCVRRHFQGTTLATLSSATNRHLQALLKAEMPQNRKDWKEEGLFNFSYSLLFK